MCSLTVLLFLRSRDVHTPAPERTHSRTHACTHACMHAKEHGMHVCTGTCVCTRCMWCARMHACTRCMWCARMHACTRCTWCARTALALYLYTVYTGSEQSPAPSPVELTTSPPSNTHWGQQVKLPLAACRFPLPASRFPLPAWYFLLLVCLLDCCLLLV